MSVENLKAVTTKSRSVLYFHRASAILNHVSDKGLFPSQRKPLSPPPILGQEVEPQQGGGGVWGGVSCGTTTLENGLAVSFK